jgi:hypothetical protein
MLPGLVNFHASKLSTNTSAAKEQGSEDDAGQ